MVRTHIQLTEEQAGRVKRAARERGIPMAELIRRCIDRFDPDFEREGFSLVE